MDLGQVSGDYYWAAREIEQLQKELAVALSKEDFEKITQLQDFFTEKETIAGKYFTIKALLMA